MVVVLLPGSGQGEPVRAQARERNNFSRLWASADSAPSGPARHWVRLEAMIAKPARSSAWLTATSWVTMSLQSRPCSIIRRTPPIWPWARRSRLATAPSSSGLSATMVTPLGRVRQDFGSGPGSGGLGLSRSLGLSDLDPAVIHVQLSLPEQYLRGYNAQHTSDIPERPRALFAEYPGRYTPLSVEPAG